MKMVAVVPARKGSKRLPGKNIKLLNGKPLIQHTIDAIQTAAIFDKIIVTTDDREVQRLFSDASEITLDQRPAELATDDIQCAQVLHYVIRKYHLNTTYDYLCLLQPTCPLRNGNHIRESFKIVTEKKPASVVSVRQYEFPPQFALEIDGHRLVKKWEGIVRTDSTRPMYHPNGAIIWLNINIFHTQNMTSYYTQATYPYIMDWKSSVDIDDQESFELAEMIFFYQRHEKKGRR